MSDDISMEKRMVLALVLSALVLFLWQAFLAPKRTEPATPTPTPEATTYEPTPTQPPAQPTAYEQAAAEQPPAAAAEERPADVRPTVTGAPERIVLSGEEMIVSLDTLGAHITQVALVNYADPFEHDRRLEMFSTPEGEVGALQVIDPVGAVPLAQTVYQVVRRSETEVVMEAAWENGLRLRKTFRLDPTHFHVDLELEATNESENDLKLSYLLVGSPGLNPETRKAHDLEAKVYSEQSKVKSVRAAALRSKGPRTYPGAELTWAAGVNQYFAVALVPQERATALVVLTPGGSVELVRTLAGLITGSGADPLAAKEVARTAPVDGGVVVLLLSRSEELAPGAAVTHAYRLFCGPKKDDVLASYSAENLPPLVSFGMFSPLSSVLLFILKGFYKVSRNYGVAIILLTILIKAALLPLSHKSQVSMHRMQQLQPKVKELQERHKGDKQKLGEEQMKMWREHGVNPFGGCLPMLLQFPVFIALFRALRTSFELRQRSFLWIDDLSQPDALATLPFSLPIIGNGLNLLPLLWMGSMVLSQSLMPRPKTVDPQQKQQQMMTKFFPLLFGVMLYNFPAGLFLYFVTMSFLSIFEQRFIRRRLATLPPTTPKPKPAKPSKPTPEKPLRKRKR